MTRLKAMLEQFMGTRIVAPLAAGVRGTNVTHYDCHCGSDDCSSDCIGPSR